MNLIIEVQELLPRDWQRLRTLRLASLADSPQAYFANYEVEAQLPESTWRERLSTVRYVTAIIAEQDISVMSIEELDGDFGANIWLGGCWVDPSVRGQGVMRVMLNYIDSIANERNWRCQGLGVWPNNFDAIAAYEKLGFVKRGELQESSRKPGLFFQRMIRQSPSSF